MANGERNSILHYQSKNTHHQKGTFVKSYPGCCSCWTPPLANSLHRQSMDAAAWWYSNIDRRNHVLKDFRESRLEVGNFSAAEERANNNHTYQEKAIIYPENRRLGRSGGIKTAILLRSSSRNRIFATVRCEWY